MDNSLQNCISGDEQHPPREQLLLYVDRELASRRTARVETHLGACCSCRAHVSKIEKSIADIMEFDAAMLTSRLGLPPDSWRGFDGALRLVVAESGRRSLLSIVFGSLRLFSQ